jgi:hypothetical protein
MKLLSKGEDKRQENVEAMDRLIEKMKQRKEELDKSITWAINFRNTIANGGPLEQVILLLDDDVTL